MAAAVASQVRKPAWLLTYQGVPITARIDPMALSIAYTSHETGLAPDMELELEDRGRRWQKAWLPTRGDLVSLSIGYFGETLVPCPDFQVDEVEFKGPPDKVYMRCMAAFVTPGMRTQRTIGYENQTLIQIASTIAAKYGLTVKGIPDAINVPFARITQRQETDLSFLHRIAQAHNYDFNVRGTTLVFYARPQLEQAAPVINISRGEVTTWKFKTKTNEVYKAATVAWQDPASKQLITATAVASPSVPTGDTRSLSVRCENGQQAALKAQAALHDANSNMITGSLSMPGNVILAGGSTVMVSNFGWFDGKYLITTARHKVNRASGYTSEIELRNVVVAT